MLRIVVELDGPVIDIQPVYWAAYSHAVAALGLARTAPATFWRLLRRGAGGGEMLAGAKPRHLERFRESFTEALESDESLAAGVAQDGASETLRAVTAAGCELALVTLGRNTRARQARLDTEDLSIHFVSMTRLPEDPFRRVAELKQLADDGLGVSHAADARRTADDPRNPHGATRSTVPRPAVRPPVLVAAASEPLVKASNEAGLHVAGVSDGPCTGRRLTQAGAGVTFPDLAALHEDLATGGAKLLGIGLPPLRPACGHTGIPPSEPSRWSSR